MKDEYTQTIRIEGLAAAKSGSLSLDGRGLYGRAPDHPFELFAEHERPWHIAYRGAQNGAPFWQFSTKPGLDSGQATLRVWLLLHEGSDAGPVYPWHGPDIENEAVFMSIASDARVEHVLQQTAWLLECIDPDGIVVDETFAGIGFDHHPERCCITSGPMIRFMKRLRKLIKDAGAEKALLTSDCGLAPFALTPGTLNILSTRQLKP